MSARAVFAFSNRSGARRSGILRILAVGGGPLLALLALCFCAGEARAQDMAASPQLQVTQPTAVTPPYASNVITCNVAGFVGLSTYSCELEHVLAKGFSVYALGSYSPRYSGTLLSGSGLAAGGRLYFSGNGPKGLFVGPEVDGFLVQYGNESASTDLRFGYAVGGTGGYSWLISDAVAVTPSGGVLVEFIQGSGTTPEPARRIVPFFRLSLGFAF